MVESGPAEEPEAFVESLPLTEVFGTHPKTKLLGVLLTRDEDPPTHFSVNEIVRISGVDGETVREHLADLEAVGIVEETDELDEKTVKLDESTEAVDDLRRLYAHLFESAGGAAG